MTNDSNPAAEHEAWMLEKSADWARPERGSRESISPPSMPVNSTIVCVMAARNGRFYAAPIGTDTDDLNASEAWTSVSSLAELADLLSVQWVGRDPRG